MTSKPPAGSLEYQVEAEDETIEKIALKWNTVPSEIKRLNRLSTRVIFPGQVIYVPDPNYVAPISPPPSPHSKSQLPLKIMNEYDVVSESSINEITSPNAHSHTSSNNGTGGFNIFKWKSSNSGPKPGHVEKKDKSKLSASLSVAAESEPDKNSQRRHTITEEEAKQLDEECMQRFIKVNCRIVTRSKGCFDGVLIITPSAVMFDPVSVDSTSANGGEETMQQSSTPPPASKSTSSIYDEASAIIPIEIISNVIMYEDLALKDVKEYFDYQHHVE